MAGSTAAGNVGSIFEELAYGPVKEGEDIVQKNTKKTKRSKEGSVLYTPTLTTFFKSSDEQSVRSSQSCSGSANSDKVEEVNTGTVIDNCAVASASSSSNTKDQNALAANAWLAKHNYSLGFFINGKWQKPEGRDCFSPSSLIKASTLQATQVDVDAVVTSSSQTFLQWCNVSAHERAAHLYSIARNLQKHQSLFAVLEAMNSCILSRDARSIDVAAAIRHFYHYAGWAELSDSEMKDWKPLGVTVICAGGTFSFMQMASRMAAALAIGNTVILKPPVNSPFSAFVLAELCTLSGIPEGVVNVITMPSLEILVKHPDVQCVAYAGSQEEAKLVREASAGRSKKVSLEIQSVFPLMVLEEADLDSAVEGIIDAAFVHSGQGKSSGSKLLIQESVFEVVIRKLKIRMSKLTIGSNLDKNVDVGPQRDSTTVDRIRAYLAKAEASGVSIFKAGSASDKTFIEPTLLTDLQLSSPVLSELTFGPILAAFPFRTLKEGITMANHSVYGLAASVWTENISVALEAAAMLNVGTVWINSQNVYDAAACVGGMKASGYGRMGGKKALFEFAQLAWKKRTYPQQIDLNELKNFGTLPDTSSLLPQLPSSAADGDAISIDKTFKMYYGGAQKRPESNASRPVVGHNGNIEGYVPDGGRKDLRNAVEVALTGASGWAKKDGHGRAQILYYLAENLQGRRKEFITQLSSMTGENEELSALEFERSIQRLFYWAAYCDKYGGSLQETTTYGFTMLQNIPVGVIGVVCPDNFPLLGFISLMAPAIARGNAVIMIPSGKYPLCGLSFQQVLETSDVPPGVVNILTGKVDVLTKALAEHHDVNSVWYFGRDIGSTFVEYASAGNFKRTWVNDTESRDFFFADQSQGVEFMYHATNSKTICIPIGDIFAT